MNKLSREEREARALEDWQVAKARTACDYNDESRRKGFMQKAADELGKPFNELTGDEIDSYLIKHAEYVKISVKPKPNRKIKWN